MLTTNTGFWKALFNTLKFKTILIFELIKDDEIGEVCSYNCLLMIDIVQD